MTFPEMTFPLCKNVIRNLETNFIHGIIMNSHNNIIQQLNSFKYLKNEKIIFTKVILKLEGLFYQNIYILFHLILYS